MQLTGKKILLVEDDPDLIKTLKAALEEAGTTVTVKSSVRGSQTGALDELRTKSSAYDLVILDIRLPDDDQKLSESHDLIQRYNALARELRNHIATGDVMKEDEVRDECDAVRQQYLELLDDDAALRILRELKGSGAKLLTPVLFLTSRSNPGVRDLGMEIARELCHPNGVAHLVKPILTDILLSKLASFLTPGEAG